MFTLYSLEQSQLLSNRITFVDGKRAARAARLLSVKTKAKFQVRKCEETSAIAWQERETARFEAGEYKPLEERLHNLSIEHFPLHFAHIAKKKPSLIAYTKDEVKGASDKQSLISIEAYVQLLVDKGAIEQDDVKVIARRHANYAKVVEGALKFATTPDEIERVYINYDASIHALSVSCMRHGLAHWPRVNGDRYHPTRVYGAGDLAIAYISDDEGRTIARALCWPEKKIYSRVYAGENSPLHDLLKSEGFEKSRYYSLQNPSMQGARLLLVENDHGNYVAPYMDECGAATDNGEYLIVAEYGDYNLNQTNGEVENTHADDRPICENCDERTDESDMTTVYNAIIRNRPDNPSYMCEHCADRNSYYCHGYQERLSDDIHSVEVDGDLYSYNYVESSGDINYCEYRHEYTTEDIHSVIVNDSGDEEYWSQSSVDDSAFEYDGKYYSNDLDHVEVVTERYVPRYNRSWKYLSRASNWRGEIKTNVWFVDEETKIPQSVIDDGEIEIYEGVDGRTYATDYKDNYPVNRARVMPIEAHEDDGEQSIAA